MKTLFVFEFSDNYESTFENPFAWAWIASAIFSSCYAYTWDIKMDWGLLDSNAGENTLLREEIVYSSTVRQFFSFSKLLNFQTNFFSVFLLFCHH